MIPDLTTSSAPNGARAPRLNWQKGPAFPPAPSPYRNASNTVPPSVPPAKVGCAIERALLADGHTSVWVGAVSSMEVKDDALGIT